MNGMDFFVKQAAVAMPEVPAPMMITGASSILLFLFFIFSFVLCLF
jgi:hypothetical protein